MALVHPVQKVERDLCQLNYEELCSYAREMGLHTLEDPDYREWHQHLTPAEKENRMRLHLAAHIVRQVTPKKRRLPQKRQPPSIKREHREAKRKRV